MPDERGDYVVELAVTGTAVVTVEADDAQDAIAKAVDRVRPVDVSRVDEVEATIVAGPFEVTPATRRLARRRRDRRPSAAAEGHGQGR